MTQSVVVITFSYLLIISTLLWISNIKSKLCIIYIPFCIWYSLTIGFGIKSILGYPTSNPIPDNGIIKSIHVNEPHRDYKGSMCFWVIDPSGLGKYDTEPRAYRMPYDRELHKQLMQKGNNKNSIMVWNLKKGITRWLPEKMLGSQRNPSSYGEFRLINPEKLLTKDTVPIGQSKECDGVCQ